MRRRQFLAGGLLAGASALIRPGAARSQVVRPEIPIRARNVIFLVYDGFNWHDFARARNYAYRHQHRTLAIERLFALGVAGNQTTHSLASIVTDSAAASTAWATGRKTVNSLLSMYPDGRKLTTILELAQDAGKATGIITTTRVTHATPAGFVVHVEDRNSEDDVALTYYSFRPNVMLGGGYRHFDPTSRADKRDLLAEFRTAGYDVLRTPGELTAASGSRLLGVFSNSHVPYEIDRRFQGVDVPSLAQMVSKGLEVLSGCENGFVLQVEAGRIDHANHANDPGASLWDALAADEALETILSFVDNHPETLLIFASDHGTGCGATYGVGVTYQLSSRLFDRINDHKASYEFTLEALGKSPDHAKVHDMVRDHSGVDLTEDECRMIVDTIAGQLWLPIRTAYYEQPYNTYAYVLASGGDPHAPDRLNINYASGEHTAEPVPIALYGAHTSTAQIGLVDNTQPNEWMQDAIGVHHENPIMSEEEALRVLQDSKES